MPLNFIWDLLDKCRKSSGAEIFHVFCTSELRWILQTAWELWWDPDSSLDERLLSARGVSHTAFTRHDFLLDLFAVFFERWRHQNFIWSILEVLKVDKVFRCVDENRPDAVWCWAWVGEGCCCRSFYVLLICLVSLNFSKTGWAQEHFTGWTQEHFTDDLILHFFSLVFWSKSISLSCRMLPIFWCCFYAEQTLSY